jgi:hypothetical protein
MDAQNETKLTPYAQQVKDGTTPVNSKGVEPGYFDYDGHLARRREHGQRAEVFKDGKWKLVPNMAHFLHEATDLTKDEAENRAAREGVKGPLPLLDTE